MGCSWGSQGGEGLGGLDQTAMYLQGWRRNLKPLQQSHWAIPVGMLSAARAAVVTLPGHVYVAGFNLPNSWSVYVPLASFPITLGAVSSGRVAPGCLQPTA